MLTRRLLLLLFSAAALFGADQDFNGRWNIHVQTPRGRVWWLEVTGAGTPNVGGAFVGAPGGQVDRIEKARIAGGVLEFTFERQRGQQPLKQVYRAKLNGANELQGTMVQTVGDKADPEISWRAVRAPEIKETDDGTWKAGSPVALFDGSNTSQWRLLIEGRPGWKVENGLLKNEQGAADFVSKPEFWNFILRAEYRYAQGSNSGIALRGRYEIQIYDDFGKPASDHGHGALYNRIAPAQNASKAPGEWQQIEIRLIGRQLTVTLNGVKIHDKVQIVGPTAMVMSADEGKPGPFVLQGDHGLVEFRSISVTPLTRR